MFKEYYKEVLVVKAAEGSPEVFGNGKYWKEVMEKFLKFHFHWMILV